MVFSISKHFCSTFNNAGALIADNNQFKGIDIVRFGSTISEIRDRKILENISILTQFYEALNTFSQYYQYEKIDGVIRKKVELKSDSCLLTLIY